MDHEFNQSLNEEIIEKYTEAKKLLDERITNLETAISKDTVSAENRARINEAISKMQALSDELASILERFETEEADFSETAFFEGTKYANKWDRNLAKLGKNADKLARVDELKTELNSISSDKYQSLINRGNEALDKKLASLQKKKGRIQKDQRKLLNKELAKRLKNCMLDFANANKRGDNLAKNNRRDELNDAEIEKLSSREAELKAQKGELASIRETLKSGKISVGRTYGVPLFFKEKFTQTRIKALQMKKGYLMWNEKHIVKKSVGKPFISRMKEKVANFFKDPKEILENVKEKVEPFMKPSEEWVGDFVHTQNKVIEAIQIGDEIYEVDRYGNLIRSMGKVGNVDTSEINFVTADDLVSRKGRTKKR